MSRHETSLARDLIQKPLQRAFDKIWIEKIPGGPFSLGLPDYIFVLDGLGGCIEVKKWNNTKPSPRQALHLKEIHQAGGIALLAIIGEDKKVTIHKFFGAEDKGIPWMLRAETVADLDEKVTAASAGIAE